MDTSRNFEIVLLRMAAAICAGDGEGAAACFTPNGVYHDGFYGEFEGGEAVARMVSGYFHRDARNFEWKFHDVLCDGHVGYAAYDFSYVSKLPGCEGRSAGFSGISFCTLESGLILRYSEQFDRAPVLARLGFPDERIMKAVRRWAAR